MYIASKEPIRKQMHEGFSLLECVIALLVVMIGSLAIVTVFDFSYRSNGDAKKRYSAMLLAQQRMEDVRNTAWANLTAGTTTEANVIQDNVQYQIDKTIVDNDVLTVSTAPGPETKKITVTVTPKGGQLTNDAVVMTTYRIVPRPGPNRVPNP